MTLFSLICALLIEQLRPLDAGRWVTGPLGRLSERVSRLYDEGGEGGRGAGRTAWWLLAGGLSVAAWLAWLVLGWIHPVFALAFNVGVLYLVLAHRNQSRFFADIVLALSTSDTERARNVLSDWCGSDHSGASASEVARLSIERGLVMSHRAVFGPMLWFVLLPGPTGAVLYRVAQHLAQAWSRPGAEGSQAGFGAFADRAFAAIDWVPVRLTALAFSVIGNFEDAIYCWRAQSMLWADKASGILIASGAGALGVRLGLPIHVSGGVVDRPDMGMGDKADVGYMQAAAKLIWRVLVLVLLLLALLSIASWVGR